ncbi:MAG TPA: hypothetical protein VHB68_18070 [Steroidobacteraceae bacterium]|nr:hypothetical protein [Steroidobacteraceae bacterium]
MTTPVEMAALTADPPVLYPAAANEDFEGSRSSAGWGWDPFEVWRTRIKAVQEAISLRGAS